MGRVSRSGITKILLGLIAAAISALFLVGVARFGMAIGNRKAAIESKKSHISRLGDKPVRIPTPKGAMLETRVPSDNDAGDSLAFVKLSGGSDSKEVYYFDVMEAYADRTFEPKDWEAFKDKLWEEMQKAKEEDQAGSPGMDAIAKLPPPDSEIMRDTESIFTLEHTKNGLFDGKPTTWFTVISYNLLDGRLFCIEATSIASEGMKLADLPKEIAAWRKAIYFQNSGGEEY